MSISDIELRDLSGQVDSLRLPLKLRHAILTVCHCKQSPLVLQSPWPTS